MDESAVVRPIWPRVPNPREMISRFPDVPNRDAGLSQFLSDVAQSHFPFRSSSGPRGAPFSDDVFVDSLVLFGDDGFSDAAPRDVSFQMRFLYFQSADSAADRASQKSLVGMLVDVVLADVDSFGHIFP